MALIMETQRHLQQILARVSAPSLPTARSTGTSAATSSLHSLQLIPPSISLPFGSVFTSASGMTAPPPPAAPTTAATAPATAPATSTAPPAAAARAPTPPPPPAPTVPLVVSLPLPASATTLPPTQPRHASEPLPPANANQVHAAQNPPSAPSTTPASPKNKKRKRQRQSTDNQRPPEPSNKGKGKQRKRRYSAPANTNAAESGDESSESQGTGDGAVYQLLLYLFLHPNLICLADQVPERRFSVRRRDGRARQSLTVDRLVTMGFKRSDAEASVTACGHDPDKCMVWIVSHLEEQQFQKDLNQASIQSELSKQEEAKQLKAKESEKLKNATAFPALFPTSVILSATSAAKNLKTMASTRIGEVSADSTMRQLLTKLLKLEGQAFKWYKSACECYMKQLAERLEAALGDHDVVTCCGVTTAPVNGTTTCRFVQTLAEEHTALTKALFEMPENQGGVPLAFLEADETNSFDLEEDGFEVL
ncbi:TPA: hypothetical protein N0F65_001428 [Lagenidium giganteum]|uniref:UBA domain-containing protein n=1 Tax=Lagenidium giganteum TaxID=4803 RepID=A0AAV2YZM1_9STRA|nr:TPA: hypothetical protein N0F65_001428 [Lagenidium giganteum]